MAPAGQLWSTVTDLVKWAGFLAEPLPTVLARDTMDEMCSPMVISDPEAWTTGHGLGPELYRVGERVFVGHGGSMPGYVAQLAVHRPSRTGVVAFANAYGLRGTTIRQVSLDALGTVLDAEPVPPAPWRPAAGPPDGDGAALCGRWWWMGHEYEAAFDAGAGELVLSRSTGPGTQPWRFIQEGPGRWRGRAGTNDGELLEVRRDPSGAVTALDIASCLFTRNPDPLG